MLRKVSRGATVLGILLIALIIAKALGGLKKDPEHKPPENQLPLVEVQQLAAETATFSIQSQGTVQPRTETALSAEVSGRIVNVSPTFVAGGMFAANEELLRIEPDRYEAAVQQARALVHQRQIEFDGASSLRTQGYRAEVEFAQAEAALETARAGLVVAERDLANTSIRLPYAGMVRNKEVGLGQYVTPGTRFGVVFATDYAEIRLPLTDSDLAFIDLPAANGKDEGPGVVLTAEQRGRPRSWQARITRSEGVVDERSRVTYLVARVDDPYRLAAAHHDESPLPMGTFVTAEIAGTRVDNVIRIPRDALRGRDELLFLDDQDRLRIRTVDVLRADDESAWLSAGAEPGERIVLTQLDSPINGMLVRTTDEIDSAGNTVDDELPAQEGDAADE